MTLTRKIPSKFTDEMIINGFRNNDPETIEKIYNELFPMIKRLVEFNSGTPSDAKDIFQEALMVIHKKIENDDFFLSCSFKTFLYSICRNIWFNQLRNRKVHFKEFNDNEVYVEILDNKNILKEICLNEEYFLFRHHFEKLSSEQKKLFTLFFDKYSFKQIADIMNYKNAAMARKEKLFCKKLLTENIINDPKFEELQKKQIF